MYLVFLKSLNFLLTSYMFSMWFASSLTSSSSVMYQLFFSLIFYFSEDFAPVIENCSSDIAQDTDPGAPYAIVTWMEPVGSDANGAVTTRVNYSPGNIFPLGTTAINYEVTDRTNNTANCSFRVTISGNVVVLH